VTGLSSPAEDRETVPVIDVRAPGEGDLGRWRLPLILAVLVVGISLRLAAVDHHRTVDYDEGRYLDNAVNILEGRGLQSSYTSHFFREAPPRHPEDISSPLFPYLLAGTFALLDTPREELHRVAQWWSLVPGCVAIWLTFALGRRLFDERGALFGAVMVALNADMVILSSWAMTESLYTVMVLAILLLVDRLPAGAARWGILGACCGLLYLLRANGLAIAAAVGLTALLDRARLRQGVVSAAIFSALFLATISPWLIRNQAVFGSPTYSSMKHVAWSENGRRLFTRDRPAPSLSAFLEENGAAGLARSLAHRAVRTARNVVWGDTGGYNVLCLLYLPAVLALRGAPRLRPGHLCVLFTALLLFGVPTWTGALSRYMLPLRPWIYLVTIGAALWVLPAAALRLQARGAERGGGAPVPAGSIRRYTLAFTATLLAALAAASGGPLRDYVTRDQRSQDVLAREAATWISRHTPDDAVLLEGAFVHQYAFLFERPVVWAPAGGLDEVMRAAGDYGARYLIVSEELLRYRPMLAGHFETGDEGLRGLDLPGGIDEVFAGAGRRVVIYRLPEPAA